MKKTLFSFTLLFCHFKFFSNNVQYRLIARAYDKAHIIYMYIGVGICVESLPNLSWRFVQ